MKISKIRLPVLIAASVVLCIIVICLSITVINSFDKSMMEEQISEHKASMQQVTDNVQANIEARLSFIRQTADTLSDSGKNFSYISSPENLKKYAKNGGFDGVIAITPEGIAYDSSGNKADVSDRDYFKKALNRTENISGRIKSRFPDIAKYAIVYTVPVISEDNVAAVLCGITSADMNVSDYTDYSSEKNSGMYILDGYGELVMSSVTYSGKQFYSTVKESKYSDGRSSVYQSISSDAGSADCAYAGDITSSQGFFGMMLAPKGMSDIYFKRQLAQNDWTLFYVRSVKLTESTVSFIVISRIMMFTVVSIFLVAIIIMLLLQKHSNNTIIDLAYKDEITGRANWQKFTMMGNELINRPGWWSSNYAALHIDINRFTLYNDYYGHEAGDRYLKYLAETLDLMSSAREICARRSSDKFVALWAYSDEAQLESRINEFFDLSQDGPNGSNVSLSIGIYRLSESDNDIVHAIDMAKMAYDTIGDAKSNTFAYFSEQLRKAQTEEHELEQLMNAALARDEFKLYIQPKHDVHTGELKGAEALVRWVSPVKGFIAPGRFIPLFEKNGFVAEMDNYILEQLCIFQKLRLDKGLKTVPISVNVSRVQLSNPNLAEEICAMVDKHRVPHKYIDIELTESACFDDMETLVNTMTNLKKMGFAVSMDDFGSGYSSLNLLKELPFDTLKIDGGFFKNVTNPNRANIVVKNIIGLAKSLNMNIVAEGIETEEQVNFLRTTECDLIQGYYYSKPISAGDFEKYMAKNSI
ncbi:MAG: EAL domain-containing protein [Firmicutes bacterium]|nr:EAL domain-containing protein [Bacillota bacterium]